MASGTLILRPSSDVNRQHNLSSGSACYAMLMEATADDDATYIYQDISGSGTSTQSASSTIMLSGNQISGNITVTGVTLFSRARKSGGNEKANYDCTFSISSGTLGNTSASLSSSYTNATNTDTNMVNILNQYIVDNHALPTQIQCVIHSSGHKNQWKDNNGYIRITQVYVAIDYELNEAQHLFVKENNVWQPYTKGYKKQNGVWVSTDITSLFNTDTLYVKG